MADLNKLVEQIKADSELKKQFQTAVKNNKVVEFCSKHGVHTTEKEIAQFVKTKKAELSDEDAKTVTGGCNSSTSEVLCDSTVSVITVGVGCAISSIASPLTDLTEGKTVSSCL